MTAALAAMTLAACGSTLPRDLETWNEADAMGGEPAAEERPSPSCLAGSPTPRPGGAEGGEWRGVYYDYRDRLTGLAVTREKTVWAAGTRVPHACGPEASAPLLLRGDGGRWRVVAAPPVTEPRAVAAASDRDVWLFGDRTAARWNGRRWTTAPGPGGKPERVHAAAPGDVWAILNANFLDGAGGAEEPWSSRADLRHWDGAAWRTARPPLVAKDVDGLPGGEVWVAGSSRGRAAVARWNGWSWSTVPLPAVPALHRNQLSELVDLAVDESGRVAAVGWVAWVCGTQEEDVTFCGRTLLLRRENGRWSYTLAPEPELDPACGWRPTAGAGSGCSTRRTSGTRRSVTCRAASGHTGRFRRARSGTPGWRPSSGSRGRRASGRWRRTVPSVRSRPTGGAGSGWPDDRPVTAARAWSLGVANASRNGQPKASRRLAFGLL